MSLYGAIDKRNCGTYTAVTADDTAGSLTIDTGVTDPRYVDVTIRRATAVDDIVKADAVITLAATGILTVADGAATYAITAGDIIYWMVISESQ